MALVKGTNSYVTLAEAEVYFADRLDTDAWDDVEDEEKEKALVTATTILDNVSWVGTVADDSQVLSFPRNGTYFDPRLGKTIELDSAVVPRRIELATFEMALHLLLNENIQDSSGGVESIKVGPIELELIQSPSKIPLTVTSHMKCLKINGGSSMWWRAN